MNEHCQIPRNRRIGMVNGKGAIRDAGDLPDLASEPAKDRRSDGSRHAAAGVDNDLERLGERRDVPQQTLLVRRDDGIIFSPSSRPLPKIPFLHPDPEVLDLRTVERLLADADLETVILRRIVTGGNLHPAVKIEMKKGKIEERSRTNTDIVDLKSGREKSLHHRLRVTIGCEAAIPSHGDSSPSVLSDDGPMNLAEEPGKVFVKIFFRQATDVIFPKNSRIHAFLHIFFRRANRAAKRIASLMLVPSARPFPAMSYAVP